MPRIYVDNADSYRRLWMKALLYWLRWEYRGFGSRFLVKASTIRAAQSRRSSVSATENESG